jgi:hypothetical protein
LCTQCELGRKRRAGGRISAALWMACDFIRKLLCETAIMECLSGRVGS